VTGTVTWKEYVDTRFDAQDKAVGAALASAERAVTAALAARELATTKAEEAQEKRNETFNEFRTLSNDRDKNFASTEKVDGIVERLSKLENQNSANDGKSQGITNSFGNLNTILILVLGAAAVLIPMLGGF
jgi:hypothetical protein